MYFRIYNTSNNIMYDKEDIEVIILDSDNEDLIADAKASIKEFISEQPYRYMGTSYGGTVTNIPHYGPKTVIDNQGKKTKRQIG